jgi:hypothetical protein
MNINAIADFESHTDRSSDPEVIVTNNRTLLRVDLQYDLV